MRVSDRYGRAIQSDGAPLAPTAFEGGIEQITSESLDDRSRFAVNTIMWTIVVSVLGMKIAIFQVEIPILCVYAMIGFLALSGYVRISAIRLCFYSLAVGMVLIASSVNASNISILSLLSVILFYGVFVFTIELEQPAYFHLLRKFQILGLVVAGLVFFNWGCNLLHKPWPNLDKIVPKDLLFGNYMYIQALHWGSPYTKPNAIFFLETSLVGQFLGFATIIEICFFRRLTLMAALGLATFLTFSGTGLLLILLSAPFIIPYVPRRYLIPGLLALPVVFVVAFSIGLVDNAIKRSDEFSSTRGSSGQGRFIKPYLLLGEAFDKPAKELLFGKGAGQAPKQLPTVHEAPMLLPPSTKVMVEYGIFSFVAFMAFAWVAFFAGGVPFVIGWALMVQYQFLGGSFLVPIIIMYCYFFAGAYTFSRPLPAANGEVDGVEELQAVTSAAR
jgi:hypothetical protein